MPRSSIPSQSTLERWQAMLESVVDCTGADVARIIEVRSSVAAVILSCGNRHGSAASPQWIDLSKSSSLCNAVIDTLGPVAIADASACPERSGNEEVRHGFKAYRGCPVRWPDGALFGVIDVLNRIAESFQDHHGRLLARFAEAMEDHLATLHSEAERLRTAAELHAHRERLSLAAEVVGMGIWDYDIDADTLQCDETCYRIYGLDPALGQMRRIADFKALVHPDDVERITDERMAELATSAKDRHVEFRLLRPSGESRWITSAACMLKATPFTPNRLVGVVIDITEARLAEEKLQRSHDTLRQAERIARIGSWTLDLGTGTFVTSAMLHEMNGADPDGPPLTPADLQRMLAPESFQRVAAAIARCAETGESYGIDAIHRRPDGSSFAVHICGQASRDADGRIVGLNGTVQDISEREEARARLEALADNLPNGAIYRLEHEEGGSYSLTYVSAGVTSLIGVSPQAVTADGNAFLDAIHPDDLDRYIAELERSRLTGTLFDCEVRALGPDGAAIWMRCRSAPRLSDAGTVWDGIMLDITDERERSQELRRAKEAAEAGERAKADFLATMSHEIRTPMNTVVGMTRLVRQTDLSPKQRNYLDKIDISAKALLSIINDVLDYSRIEAGMLALEDTEFELEEVLETVSAVMAMRAEEKNIEIAFSVAPDVPRRLRGDPLRLGQVLMNLVGNAVKFTEVGEIVVSVKRDPDGSADGGGHMIRFSVRDTGIGLDERQIGRLFQPFSQAEPQTSRSHGGPGLGLVICRQLVKLMGGQIGVESTPGHGSNFHFTLPARPAVVKYPQTRALLPHKAFTGTRVLIVDDNASARTILSDMVRLFGMTAEAAASGIEGLKALRRASAAGEPFEIVLMDWRMPEMDGLEAARHIREEKSLARTPAVLMVTAYGREEVLQRVERLELQGILIKPVTESTMFNTLMEILRPQALRAGDDGALAPPVPIENTALGAALAGRKVLVVDDNPLNREVATDFLELAGINVITATNGREALAALEAEPFDAVLMDIQMPEMGGLEATRIIRQHSGWADLPVIALTAQARHEDRALIEAAGMSGHLAKPIDEDRLYSILTSFICAKERKSTGPGADETRSEDGESAKAFRHIDIAAIRVRFGNRPERIMRLLSGFLRDFSDAPAEILLLTGQGNLEAIAALTHTLKGSFGYLGATRLVDDAERIEWAGRNDDASAISDLAPGFARDLGKLLVEVSMARESQIAENGPPAENTTESVASLIAKLRPLIKEGDYAAATILQHLEQCLESAEQKMLIDRIIQHFDDLELADALTMLDRLSTLVSLQERYVRT